jgi:hypothetical protein
MRHPLSLTPSCVILHVFPFSIRRVRDLQPTTSFRSRSPARNSITPHTISYPRLNSARLCSLLPHVALALASAAPAPASLPSPAPPMQSSCAVVSYHISLAPPPLLDPSHGCLLLFFCAFYAPLPPLVPFLTPRCPISALQRRCYQSTLPVAPFQHPNVAQSLPLNLVRYPFPNATAVYSSPVSVALTV